MIRDSRAANYKKAVFRIVFAVTLIAFCVTGLFLLESYRQRGLAEDYYKAVRNFAAPEELGAAELPDWISIPGTEVDYPVVQGADNVYYLDHLPDGSANQAGSIFADSRCTPESRHLILYGHNLRGGGMFGSLRRYRERTYYGEHPSLTLSVGSEQWEFPIFSVHVTGAYDGDVYAVSFESDSAFGSFVRRLCEVSLYETDWRPEPGRESETRVVTLSTCTGDSRERLVIHAALPKVTVEKPPAEYIAPEPPGDSQ